MEKFNAFKFNELLYATHNIADPVEPETAAGVNTVAAAVATASTLGAWASRSPAHARGVLIAAKLFIEVMANPWPNAYMDVETAKGHAGVRHEFDNAGLVVSVVDQNQSGPSDISSSVQPPSLPIA